MTRVTENRSREIAKRVRGQDRKGKERKIEDRSGSDDKDKGKKRERIAR